MLDLILWKVNKMKYVYKVDTPADGLVGMFSSMKKAVKQAMWEVEDLKTD